MGRFRLCCAVVCASVAWLSPNPAPAQEKGEFAKLAEAYEALDRYRDEGEVEIVRFEEGSQHVTRLRFTTRRTRSGFHFEVRPKDGGESVVWTDHGQLSRYDAASNRIAVVTSFREALQGILGPSGQEALWVPRFLLGEAQWSSLAALPKVETGQPCAVESPVETCRVLTWSSPSESASTQRTRLWIGQTSGLVRKVEVESGPGEPEPLAADSSVAGGMAPSRAWTWVQVVHTLHPLEQGGAGEPVFVPPADARKVALISETSDERPALELVEGTAAESHASEFFEEVRVSELLLPVWVTNREGRPVLGLTAEDFRLRVGGREVPIEASTWVAASDPWLAELAAMNPTERARLGLENDVPGRLVVLFFQAGLEALRIKGHMSFLREMDNLTRVLEPTDRVAVVTFDSHLKLWQDFTTRREPLLEISRSAFRFGARDVVPRPGDASVSLAEALEARGARNAATVEEALTVLARSLEPFDTGKVVLFIGWGVGHNTAPELRESYQALSDADVTLHAIDVTYASGHTLAGPLSDMASSTGGLYTSSFLFPSAVAKKVATALSGHYELSVLESNFPAGGGEVQVELRERRRGRVHHRRGHWRIRSRPER